MPPIGQCPEPFDEGARDPEEGMQTEETEGPDQETGHGPEGVEEIGISVFVMVGMGGMGQVGGEARVGVGMTGGAGLDDIGRIDAGRGVLNRHDIV